MIATLLRGVEAVGRVWCNMMHPDPAWPIDGYHRCAHRHRKHRVPWVSASETAESLNQAGELNSRISPAWTLVAAAALLIFVQPALARAGRQLVPLLPEGGILRSVQRELLALPGYTVFDYLAAKQLEDGSFLLTGSVRNATLKTAAEDAVRAIAGSARTINRIEVLPRSQRDEHLRTAAWRELYGDASMLPYAIRKVAPIHIVVKNGIITLEGTVESGLDRMQVESAMRNVTSEDVRNHLIAQDGGITTLWSIWRNTTVTP